MTVEKTDPWPPFGITPAIDSKMAAELLADAFRSMGRPEEEILRPNRAAHALAVMATERDMRMVMQQGCFTIHRSSAWSDLDLRNDAAQFLACLIIEKADILQFARELHTLGIREGDIFPDLEHLALEVSHLLYPNE